MSRAPSVKDVAKLAGVSTATVSRTLNNQQSVSTETKSAVLRAANQVGYRINHSARSLRLQRSGAIAVLIPNLGNPFFSDILAGIESVMSQSNINVLVLDTKGNSNQQSYILEYLSSNRADGIICLDGQIQLDTNNTESKMLNLPVVFACEWPTAGDYSVIRSDNTKGAKLAVQHLIELGHTSIGHVAGPPDNILTIQRQQGVIAALKENKLRLQKQWVFSGDFGIESGVQAAQQWLNLENRPTGLFCSSDLMAIGLMAELKKHQVGVPDDVSIIGFDDIAISQYYSPTLTTIRQPTRELGVTSAMVLLDRLHDDSLKSVNNLLDVELIKRASTSPIST